MWKIGGIVGTHVRHHNLRGISDRTKSTAESAMGLRDRIKEHSVYKSQIVCEQIYGGKVVHKEVLWCLNILW